MEGAPTHDIPGTGVATADNASGVRVRSAPLTVDDFVG
jgi:hypothetical protein